jgi:integrase
MTPGRSTTRRDFGNIRRTSAGRYQVRYPSLNGTTRNGPHTFPTNKAATDYLARVRTEQLDGKWMDPQKFVPTVDDYFPHFQRIRRGRGGGGIKPKTRELSEHQYRAHIASVFGSKRLDHVTVAAVNGWYSELPDGAVVRRQVYSLMKAMMNAARNEGYLPGDKNPCQIVGAGQNRYSERPHMSIEQVDAILSNLEGDMFALATLAFNAHLRLGEVLALRRGDVDLVSAKVHVRRAVTEVGNVQVEGTPKNSHERTIDLDVEGLSSIRDFLGGQNRQPGDRLFQRADASTLRHFHVHRVWNRARQAAGLPQFRFHDLRHAGLTMLAEAGVPISGLKYRAGHESDNAALGYQHRANSRGGVEADLFAARKAEARAEAESLRQNPPGSARTPRTPTVFTASGIRPTGTRDHDPQPAGSSLM